MNLGDVQAWTDNFVSLDDRLLERIAVVWPSCQAALVGQPEEDAITINLVDRLGKDPIVRRLCHWVEYQFEPFGIAPDGSKYSKGKVDIGVLLDWERERYLAYECKRLNVIQAAGRGSLATAYVTQGMMRFMTEQYAEGLPIGCMLGYVMDGDIEFAMERLTKAIAACPPLALLDGPTQTVSVQHIPRFLTRHNRPTSMQIELRHALLSYLSLA